MLKPTTDPNAGDARRDVEPTPRVDPRTGTTVLPLASNSRMVAGMRARPRHRGAGRARHHRPKKTCSTSTTNTAALERRDRRRPYQPQQVPAAGLPQLR